MWIKQAHLFMFSTGYPQKVEKLRKQDKNMFLYTFHEKNFFIWNVFKSVLAFSRKKW